MAALICILAMTSIVTCGCWDRREPETLVFPTIVGFDIDDAGEFEVLAQFPNPTARAGGATATQGSGGAIAAVPFWLNSGKGVTPFDALKDLTLTTSRQISLSHVDVVLISERLARRGISPVTELLLRNHELRLVSQAAIVEGDLRDLLESELPLEPTPGLGLLRLLEYAWAEQSQIPTGDLLQKLRVMGSFPGLEVTFIRMSVLSAAEHQSLADPSSMGGELPKQVVKIHGCAAFNGDQMVGWLEAKESCGLNWLLGDVSRAAVALQSPQDESLISIELKQSSCELKSVVSGGNISIDAVVGVLARVQGVTSPPGERSRFNPDDPEVTRSLEQRIAQAVRDDIELAIEKAKELGVDVFGFGNVVYRKAPKAWDEVVQGRWNEFFRTLTVNLDVEVDLRRPGLSMSSVTPH